MLEQSVKDEMRLYVMEYFVASLWAMSALQTPSPEVFWKRTKEQIIAGAQRTTFPKLADPAMSDLLSAELESAATHLASMVDAQIDLVLKVRNKGFS
jgi:hypothetical protein